MYNVSDRLEIEKKNNSTKMDPKPSTMSEGAEHRGEIFSKSFETNDGKKNCEKLITFPEEKYPELTKQMFFDFMRTAYQVNDNCDQLSSVLAANSEIDWTELAKIDLDVQSATSKSTETDNVVNEGSRSSSSPTSHISDQVYGIVNKSPAQSPSKKFKPQKTGIVVDCEETALAKMVKKSLSDILHEGLLDSVLPYMLPKQTISQPIIKKPLVNTDIKKSSSMSTVLDKTTTRTSAGREKENDKTKIHKKSPETEVEIHVCDETKNIKKDFRCPQKLLIQKMCYFADVTAGQKLEEMDISVHCDIVIFDWLMRWVKKDIIKKSEWPILEASNVIPITVSASFLQMEPLLDQCLTFCHENMSDVLKTSTILTCLNDNIFTRLADLFTNVDVETLKDKKDKVQSRLFCKLIIALADPVPDNKKGHYSSLATLFKCGKCGKNVIRSVSDSVPCIPSAMRIDNKGNIHSKHTRDLSWTLNDYILNLRSELRSWRKVYWRLWGDCHFLYCRQCSIFFPVHQMDWCCYHPEIPQFFANEQQRSAAFPLGRYPCCGQRAYRFEALPNHQGCRFKEHIPVVSVDNDGHVLNVLAMYRDVISQESPQLFFPEKITRIVPRDPSLQPGKLECKEPMWWDGIELVPPRSKLGLLGKIWGGAAVRKPCQTEGQKHSRKLRPQSSQMTEISSPISSTTDSDEEDGVTGCESSIDEDSDNSEESHSWQLLKSTGSKTKRRYHSIKRNDGARSWNMNLAIRHNQDNQRDFEEKAATQMVALLTKRTSAECGSLTPKSNKHGQGWSNQPTGGTYVKLEAEFREQLAAQSCKSKNSGHLKGPIRVRSSKA